MNWNEVLSTVLPVLLTSVVIPAIIILGKKLDSLMDEKIKDARVKKYLEIAIDCVVDSVEDVAHDYADRLSKEEWNDTTKRLALLHAKESVIANIGTAGQTALTEALGDFDKWLETKIKAEVQRRKNALPQKLEAITVNNISPMAYSDVVDRDAVNGTFV